MMDQRLQERIHAALDGELDAAGREALEEVLERAPEARAYRDRMAQLDQFLTRIPPAEPPSGLHGQIMSAVRLPRARRRGAFRLPTLPGFVRYGFAAAAGLLLAVGMYEYRPGSGADPDPSRLTGTVLPANSPVMAETLDRDSFSLGQFNGSVALKRLEQGLILDFDLDTPGAAVEIRVDYAGAGEAGFGAVHQLQGQLESMELAGEAVTLTAAGRQQFSLALGDGAHNRGGRIEVSWSSDGKLLKSVDLNWGDQGDGGT